MPSTTFKIKDPFTYLVGLNNHHEYDWRSGDDKRLDVNTHQIRSSSRCCTQASESTTETQTWSVSRAYLRHLVHCQAERQSPNVPLPNISFNGSVNMEAPPRASTIAKACRKCTAFARSICMATVRASKREKLHRQYQPDWWRWRSYYQEWRCVLLVRSWQEYG